MLISLPVTRLLIFSSLPGLYSHITSSLISFSTTYFILKYPTTQQNPTNLLLISSYPRQLSFLFPAQVGPQRGLVSFSSTTHILPHWCLNPIKLPSVRLYGWNNRPFLSSVYLTSPQHSGYGHGLWNLTGFNPSCTAQWPWASDLTCCLFLYL